MTTISLKLPERLARRLETAARERKATRSTIVRNCLEQVLVNGAERPQATFHDLAKDLCGKFTGPRDLASHPKHLVDFGK